MKQNVKMVNKKFNILLMILGIFMISCGSGEVKYCYYQDYRSYVHKQFFVTTDKRKAVKMKELYMNLKSNSISDFHDECARGDFWSIKSKKEGEIIRYYPELGIAKVLFRFSNEELNAPGRLDVRKKKYYIPIFLLHDTLPVIDTVKFIPS